MSHVSTIGRPGSTTRKVPCVVNLTARSTARRKPRVNDPTAHIYGEENATCRGSNSPDQWPGEGHVSEIGPLRSTATRGTRVYNQRTQLYGQESATCRRSDGSYIRPRVNDRTVQIYGPESATFQLPDDLDLRP
jgi:hypothetical protein